MTDIYIFGFYIYIIRQILSWYKLMYFFPFKLGVTTKLNSGTI